MEHGADVERVRRGEAGGGAGDDQLQDDDPRLGEFEVVAKPRSDGGDAPFERGGARLDGAGFGDGAWER